MDRDPGQIIGALLVIAAVIASFIVISVLKQKFLEEKPNPRHALALAIVCYILTAVFAALSVFVIYIMVTVAQVTGGNFIYFWSVVVSLTVTIVYLCQAIAVTRRFDESKGIVGTLVSCPKCGNMIAANADFCSRCGSGYKNTSFKPKKACPNCGQLVDIGAVCCPYCSENIAVQGTAEDKPLVYASSTKPE